MRHSSPGMPVKTPSDPLTHMLSDAAFDLTTTQDQTVHMREILHLSKVQNVRKLRFLSSTGGNPLRDGGVDR